MKKYILLLLIVSFIFSCSEKETTVPDDIIKQKEMTSVLTDIHLAQATFSIKARTDTSANSLNDYVNFALQKHNLKREEFLKSLKFYSEHPEILQLVYDSVITGLTRMQGGEEKN